jgi:hypothetical protein
MSKSSWSFLRVLSFILTSALSLNSSNFFQQAHADSADVIAQCMADPYYGRYYGAVDCENLAASPVYNCPKGFYYSPYVNGGSSVQYVLLPQYDAS